MKNGRGNKWQLDDGRKKRVRTMLGQGYTLPEMASSLCVSTVTLASRLREAGLYPADEESAAGTVNGEPS